MTVTEDEIASAIDGGAHSIEAVGEACEAGTGCHSCHDAIACLLRDHTDEQLKRSRSRGALRQLSLLDDLRSTGAPRGAARRPPKPKARKKSKS